MQAITTRYLGPTDRRGSRVKATTASGMSVTLSWEYAWDSDRNHTTAAEVLFGKLGWAQGHYKLAGGHLKDGMVFVMVPIV